LVFFVTEPADHPVAPAGPPPLRLGTAHLLLWILTCSLVLTGYRLLNDPEDILPQERLFSDFFQLVMSIGYSLALTALLVLVARRWWGDRRFPTHAGHWLVIVGVITLAIDGGSLAAVKLYAVWQGRDWTSYWSFYQAGAWSLGTAVGLALLIGVRMEWRWRAVIAAISAFTGLNAIEHGAAATGYYIARLSDSHDIIAMAILISGIAALVTASAIDISSRQTRDWLHWSGVTAWLGLSVMQVATILFNWSVA
jgi:hypothetical protein